MLGILEVSFRFSSLFMERCYFNWGEFVPFTSESLKAHPLGHAFQFNPPENARKKHLIPFDSLTHTLSLSVSLSHSLSLPYPDQKQTDKKKNNQKTNKHKKPKKLWRCVTTCYLYGNISKQVCYIINQWIIRFCH